MVRRLKSGNARKIHPSTRLTSIGHWRMPLISDRHVPMRRMRQLQSTNHRNTFIFGTDFANRARNPTETTHQRKTCHENLRPWERHIRIGL
ncbi:MAG TPA: hypothetical protein DEW10_04505 [Bifidobacterium sp.]|nr:hypothetical protein [Bifidobacterium sp.]HCH22020.1 hypothetical protein [Bifidobacterium sp.]